MSVSVSAHFFVCIVYVSEHTVNDGQRQRLQFNSFWKWLDICEKRAWPLHWINILSFFLFWNKRTTLEFIKKYLHSICIFVSRFTETHSHFIHSRFFDDTVYLVKVNTTHLLYHSSLQFEAGLVRSTENKISIRNLPNFAKIAYYLFVLKPSFVQQTNFSCVVDTSTAESMHREKLRTIRRKIQSNLDDVNIPQ